MIEDSFISLPKEKVIELCEETITRINKERQVRDNKYLNKIMRDKNKSWVRRLFRKPKITIEQAKEYADWWVLPSSYAWKDFDTAKRVLGIAKASNDVVYISSSDFRSIS
jgi:hypothetical protein